MADFVKLCKRIVDTNGNPTVKDILDCGYSLDHFIKMSQPNIKAEKLLKNARQELCNRNIYYK